MTIVPLRPAILTNWLFALPTTLPRVLLDCRFFLVPGQRIITLSVAHSAVLRSLQPQIDTYFSATLGDHAPTALVMKNRLPLTLIIG